MSRLNDLQRQELKGILADARMSGMFGDGLEMEYIYYGCTIVGLNQMTDEDLVKELEQFTDEDDSYLIGLKLDLSIDKKINE